MDHEFADPLLQVSAFKGIRVIHFNFHTWLRELKMASVVLTERLSCRKLTKRLSNRLMPTSLSLAASRWEDAASRLSELRIRWLRWRVWVFTGYPDAEGREKYGDAGWVNKAVSYSTRSGAIPLVSVMSSLISICRIQFVLSLFPMAILGFKPRRLSIYWTTWILR